ncbi:MAG: HlyD family efflux transporter periplasmic adaptor subunit [Clostridiales bacterium]|nr:HlyD family efflux transporter periplasmic adaptor subunit [Clostridiales bacterium]
MKLNLGQNPAPTQTPSGGAAVKPSRKKGHGKKLVALVLVCAIAGGGLRFAFGRTKASAAPAASSAYTTAAVERRNITASITGSGTLEAANSYSVTTLLEGTILTAEFEEGDQVEEGTVLYTIDSSNASSSLEKAEISLNQSQRSYNNKLKNQEDLNVTATASGRVIALDVEVGDDVSAGQTVATIRNSDVMGLTVPFPADDAAGFSLGQTASVTLDSTFETLNGTVSKISAVDTVLSGNRIVREVTIDVSNPGGISTSQSASAEIAGVGSSSGGTFAYADEAAVTAKISGEVASLRVSEGDWVDEDQLLLVLSSDTLADEIQSASESLRSAQLSLESQYDQLADYTITSPISGTIIDKNYKAGETSESNQVLCSIYDLSYLTMTLSVDELDIADIAVGQTVSITADAVDDQTYKGVVTKVSVAGTSSSGVTTYPVTIRIDETDGLLPGMSADATIVLGSAEGVLAIPSAALMRGSLVLVTADSPTAANGASGESDASASQQGGGYVSVQVTVGIRDDNYLEITSGLQEGDTVAYIPTTSSGNTFQMGMMPGGGIPGVGGMPGGGGGGMGGAPGGF